MRANAPVRLRPLDQRHGFASLRLAFADDAEIKPDAAGLHGASQHLVIAEAVIELGAGLATLADLDQRGTEREAIAETEHALDGAARRQILAERAGLLQ